ncbi:MAG: sugar ABC transporter ATP-binding protein [Sneathiella sp.]|uniref:sugar ABC transporter ATP-binding protein n=1 Tax=Sneathiella sp. TaxID=1964365 RepID=UPI0030034A88
MSIAPAVEIYNFTKAFGPTIANKNVSFSVEAGSVHALLGENGAGKSTTMKLLSGLVQPDTGGIKVDGQNVSFKSPRDAHKIGIQTAFQELTLIPDLTVLDNMMLPAGPTNFLSILQRNRAGRAVSSHFDKLGLNIELSALAGGLDLATKQKIEIARALYKKPKILLLDEPTSSLSGDDVEWLGQITAQCKEKSITVIFITHRMAEVRAFCDTLTILRNGEHVKSADVAGISDNEVLELIIGRSVDNTFPPRMCVAELSNASPVLQARNLAAGDKLSAIDIDLHPGEILGVAGLQGMGAQALFLSLFGAIPIEEGEMLLDGKSIYLASPADAVHPSVGIGMVPEERKTQGLFLKLDGIKNISLPVVDEYCRHGLIDLAAESAQADQVFASMEVDARASFTSVGTFSGGNQQKIAIAKWLFSRSRILLLFDPTRGIDVGTKHQIYQLMHAYTKMGGAILFHSTEIPELVHLSDRVAVLYEGQINRWLSGEEINETAMMEAALGGKASKSRRVLGAV